IGTDFWQRHLQFRDHLRAHPEIAKQYAALKRTLAARDWQDMNEYADAKTDFIRRVEADAARHRETS
ncbi:MAG TPA: GrpB family protein, partial [Pirellulales bacterium]|nr:GrpB family protein [Pirellulales bacterium]